MKHMQSEKQTIAWFKIAECVSRGEKERALGVYRLLSYSFNDNAVARQLEADIYLSFNEQDKAIDLYKQAIQLYQKTGRFLEAVAVCEHLITLTPHNFLLRHDAVTLYKIIGVGLKVTTHLHYLIVGYIQEKKWREIEDLIRGCRNFSDPIGRVMIYQHIITILYSKEDAFFMAVECLEKSIDDLLIANNEKSMQEFLGLIQALDDTLYGHAVIYLKNIE